jgi:hypothetical protein
MNQFEKVYQTDPSRENDHIREKNSSIELSDNEYLKKYFPIPELLENKIIEETIEIKTNEKSKSKTPKRKLKKIVNKSNKSTMANIQKKLP